MTNEADNGLIKKYDVSRLGDNNNKHLGCRYFVLDPRHDPHAVTALEVYADVVRADYPHLAHDIDNWLTAVEIEKEEIARQNRPATLTPEQISERDCFIEHSFRCCIVHGTHSNPHVSCILR